MIVEIKAPENFDDGRGIYLGGGMSNHREWRKTVVDALTEHTEKAVCTWLIFNPQMIGYDPSNEELVARHSVWEFNRLETCEIFTMYFPADGSFHALSLYQLGRYIERMKQRFPDSWQNRIVISVDRGYPKPKLISYQTFLATDGKVKAGVNEVPFGHALKILGKIYLLDAEGIPKLFRRLNAKKALKEKIDEFNRLAKEKEESKEDSDGLVERDDEQGSD